MTSMANKSRMFSSKGCYDKLVLRGSNFEEKMTGEVLYSGIQISKIVEVRKQ